MKKRFIAVSLLISLLTLLTPVTSVQALAATMPSAGNANLSAIDISHYNVPRDSNGKYLYDKIDWAQVKAGQKAVYIKATEGRTYTDPCFKTLAAAAQNAGVSHGFYAYFWPNADAAVNRAQADYFYNAIKNIGYDCIPVLDVEETSGLGKKQISSAVRDFAQQFKNLSGRDIMIYASNYFITDYFESDLSRYKLWVARYNGAVQDTPVWHSWDMWQYSGGLPVNGMPTAVDTNWATSNIFLNAVSGITWVDRPSGTYKTGDITVSGWAISYYGVSRVDIYVDGKCMGSISKDQFAARNDIESKFGGSGYEDAINSGYSLTLPDGTLTNGVHNVCVASIDDRGNAVWSANKSFTVNVPDDKLNLERPSGTYNGDVNVSGWAISRFGIDRVDVYVDGKCYGSVAGADLTTRNDVAYHYADQGYGDISRSGFSFTIPNTQLSAGTHEVRTAVINNKGKAVWSAPKTITFKVSDIRSCIDKPSGSYSGDVMVSGWALSHYGVQRVDIYVDGKGFGSVGNADMTQRTDVERCFANYGYNDTAHSGFSYKIPYSALSGGSHVVRAAVIDNAGNVSWTMQKTFTVTVPDNKVNVDSPNGICTGDIKVSGWAISHFGVSRTDIYIDGKGYTSIGNAAMTQRTDVQQHFANQGYTDMEHSGFYTTLPAGTLSAGTHNIRIAMIDKSGRVLWSDPKTFTVS